ncbi:MAG TPA: ATP-binding protein, partial [Flavisolibacter sp.]|nr:ATP-binding protein [Flavisolibacter sp.]
YVASHDLQEPLRMVTSFLGLLQKKHAGEFDETSKKYIHFAVDGAERMKGLIQDLLQYSRLDAAAEKFTPVDGNHLLQEVLHLFAASIAETGAVVRYEALPVVWGNKTQLLQLFQNLVGNALKYRSEKQPLITVHCREEDRRWLFAVSDNGIGIDPKYFQKIFVIFQRLHNKSEYSGSGIGLAICKKIVENHGGKIWVEANPAGGSTFYFTLTKNHPL